MKKNQETFKFALEEGKYAVIGLFQHLYFWLYDNVISNSYQKIETY